MKKLIFLFLFVSPVFAEGPYFSHKDPIENQEFENVYKDVRNRLKDPLNVSSGTVSQLNSTTISATTVTANGVTVGIRATTPTGGAGNPSLQVGASTSTGLFAICNGCLDVTSQGLRVFSVSDGATGGITSVVNGFFQVPDGSASRPAITFGNDQDTGFYRASGNTIQVALGGSRIYNMDSNRFGPESDNTATCGATGQRWSAVWAANGTIQTSSSKRKRQIREIEFNKKSSSLKNLEDEDVVISSYSAKTSSVRVPRGIVFKWKGKEGKAEDKDMIGFVGDDLPEEAHAILPNGKRDPENFYLSSVVGILSSKIIELEKRIEVLEAN